MRLVARRSSRLTALLDALRAATRASRPATAKSLADRLGISLRTLYRDLDRLRAAGVPVAGKAGVGIALEKGAKIPDTLAKVEGRLEQEARVQASARGLQWLADDVSVELERGRGAERVVRAATRDALVRAVLRAGGDVVVLSPDKVRREVRALARATARAHKG
jgi:predicted DNA-binding transcriptional regulator YafY